MVMIPNRTNSIMPYLLAIVLMSGLGIVAVIAITLTRPAEDNSVLIGLVFGFLLPTTMSLLALMKAQETHLSVNSRLDAFIEASSKAAHAEGRRQGEQESQGRSTKTPS